MSLDPNAPITRFGRWIDTLQIRDFLVLLVLSPALGLASVVGPAIASDVPRTYPGGIMRNSIENMTCQTGGVAILCLFGTGAIVAFLSPRLGVWAASTAMASYIAWAMVGALADRAGHNLLPFELGGYLLLTGFALAGAALVSVVLERRVFADSGSAHAAH